MSNTGLYEQDFYAWANEQAGLPRAVRLSEADIEHIAGEIERLGTSARREPVSRLAVLPPHLLEWHYQPNRRGAWLDTSIGNDRDHLVVHPDDRPSLESRLPTALGQAVRYAPRDADTETGLPKSAFPQNCPWSFDRIMDHNCYPEATN